MLKQWQRWIAPAFLCVCIFIPGTAGSLSAGMGNNAIRDGSGCDELSMRKGSGSDELHHPVACAGPTQHLTLKKRVLRGSERAHFKPIRVGLDGDRSYDPDGDVLTFAWSLTAKPEGSAAVLFHPDTNTPTFVADRPGTYVVQLIVGDGTHESKPDQVTIVVTTPEEF